jgi:hypothetical protein
LDGPGFEPQWAKVFFVPVQTAPEAYLFSSTMGTEALSQGVKWLGYGTDHASLSSTEVKHE